MPLAPGQASCQALLHILQGHVLPKAPLLTAARQKYTRAVNSQGTKVLLQLLCVSSSSSLGMLCLHLLVGGEAQAGAEEGQLYQGGLVAAHKCAERLEAQLLHSSIHQAAAEQGG